MKIALCQINTTVGDFEGNAAKILAGLKRAEAQGAHLALFPELAVCGYPPRDLLENPSFIQKNLETVEYIARQTGQVAAVVGFVSKNATLKGRALFNSAGLLHQGRVQFVQHKALLPEYDVFDEARHFEPAPRQEVVELQGVKLGLTLCEDLWSMHRGGGRRLYSSDPVQQLAQSGAQIILNLSASPFTLGKQTLRRSIVCDEARDHGVPVVYCNLVGGNDELVFDGRSFVADAQGVVRCEAKAFEEDFIVVDTEQLPSVTTPTPFIPEEEIYGALTLGLRDYMGKCGFTRAVIGISGGIDSAVVAAVACDAIGASQVSGVMMPSPYTSQQSLTDGERLMRNLGMPMRTVPIADIYQSYRQALGVEKNDEISLVEENLQARIRGNILMAISNRDGALVLSTGNKSEMSVGYCTLYGDMAGGLALISDIPKGIVYALARSINRDRERIPQAIIDRAPSAELKPNQTDQDSLPPYDILDQIMRAYIEEREDVDAIVKKGFDRNIVERVSRMIDTNEYKRRQAAPGIKITSKAFGYGRRIPIAWKP